MSLDDTLESWGEFRLLDEIVLPLFARQPGISALGDDCAFLDLPPENCTLVITTDVAPKPLVWSLGHESYWTWGWYAVLVNVSDLASAAARPQAITTSVEGPSTMSVSDFRAFFEGLAAACREMGLINAGGNLRAAPRFGCHGTAFGTTTGQGRLGRSGCRPGDVLVSVGDCGRFAAAYVQARLQGLDAVSADERQRLLKPMPRTREMALLHQHGLLRAASDNSDGVLGSLWNIAERSGCQIELDLDDALIPAVVSEAAFTAGLDPWNLMFFWGDWQVIAAIASDDYKRFQRLASAEDIRYHVLGLAVDGKPALIGRQGRLRRELRLLRNENFIRTSYNADITSNVDYMLKSPLFQDLPTPAVSTAMPTH